MPNTLVHIGVQTLVSRKIIANADYKWILIGCVIPDVPWILQRLIPMVADVDPYFLRLYAIVQSSFLFCVVLSLLLSSFSKFFFRTFLVLSINALMHLLLDAMQTKWANGVHLFAPINWNLLNFSLFWPENWVTYFLSSLGFVGFLVIWRHKDKTECDLTFRPVPVIVCLVIYCAAPPIFFQGPLQANNHFIHTLQNKEQRHGKAIEIDRGRFENQNGKNSLHIFTGETINLEGIDSSSSAFVSVKGVFADSGRIEVKDHHFHQSGWRDSFSYVGLTLIGIFWFRFLYKQFSTIKRDPHKPIRTK